MVLNKPLRLLKLEPSLSLERILNAIKIYEGTFRKGTQSAITCSKLTIKAKEQGVKNV